MKIPASRLRKSHYALYQRNTPYFFFQNKQRIDTEEAEHGTQRLLFGRLNSLRFSVMELERQSPASIDNTAEMQ